MWRLIRWVARLLRLNRGGTLPEAAQTNHAAPHDLVALAAFLNGRLPGNPPMVDLQGRTLSGDLKREIRIRRPGLILKNGTIQLPPKMWVLIEAEGVLLHDITITRAKCESGTCALYVKARSVKLELCRVAGVLVGSHSAASLLWCVLSGSEGPGVAILGPDSHVEVVDCDAHHNQCAGFSASGTGAVMSISGRCRATSNKGPGFSARAGARVTCADGCTAVDNPLGFGAADVGTVMTVGQGCKAERNQQSGFLARDGAHMTLGQRDGACLNGGVGFVGTGPGSQLSVGKGAGAVRNGACGVAAFMGATTVVGEGCVSTSNASYGFLACHQGSTLQVEGKGRAGFNQISDFGAGQGGVLKASKECQVVLANGTRGVPAGRGFQPLTDSQSGTERKST